MESVGHSNSFGGGMLTDSLHDDGAFRMMTAEGHSKKQLFGPLHPSTLRSSHSGG